ncbi:MAG: IS1595 family transposase [Planctomycetota bacterium]
MCEKRKQRRVASNKDEVIRRLPAACRDEQAAIEFFEWLRWGVEPACPRCGDIEVRMMKSKDGGRNRRWLWRCRGCKRQFTVRIGTIMEDSPIPLQHWAYAFWALCAGKKGCSSLQLSRMTGLSYKSALFLTHRIRYAMANEHDETAPMRGIVEADETFVGGKPRYPAGHPKRKEWSAKTPVLAVLQRDGVVRASVAQSVTSENVREMLRANLHRDAHLMTDEQRFYDTNARKLGLRHDTVTHWAKEYVRAGDPIIHTNSIESFWSMLKRGLNGTYHAVSKEHLHRYVSEFQFRHNTRNLMDGERVVQAIGGTDGRRLCYREPESDRAA